MTSMLERIRSALDPASAIPTIIFYGLMALAFLAAQRKSRRIGAVAIVGMTSWMSGYQLLGWAVIPVLVWARRLRPNLVPRWVLPASLILGVIILALRLPWPRPMPRGATVSAEAHIEHILPGDRVFVRWVNRTRNSSERVPKFEILPQPLEAVRLQVPAVGAAPATTVVDSVDGGSVDNIATRATVPVVMPVGNPGAARIAIGQRTWARVALIRFVTSMYLWGAFWAALSVLVARPFHRLKPAVA